MTSGVRILGGPGPFIGIVCNHFGIDIDGGDWRHSRPIQSALVDLVSIGNSYIDIDDLGLRRIMNDIDRLKSSIDGLDQHRTMSMVRRSVPDYLKEMAEEKIGNFVIHRPAPIQWIDAKALSILEELRNAVDEVKKRHDRDVAWRPNGRGGRRPKRKPYMAALVVARLYRDMTQTAPTFWNNGETPYSLLLKDVFIALGIDAHPRRPAEWALRQIAGETADMQAR